MKKLNSAKALFGFLGLATFASLVGTVSGTLAWYAYSARATLSYSGTSIENSMQLQIGLVSPIEMPHIEDDVLNEAFWDVMSEEDFSTENEHYYFAPMGVGLTSNVINAYLKVNGYATNVLEPVTTGYYDPEDPDCEFSLKKAPTAAERNQTAAAPKTRFLKMQLAFRASYSKSGESSFVENKELWLSDAKAVASSEQDGNISNALRIFFDRGEDYDSDFIINPNAANDQPGATKVGGLLDLSGDKYFDFDDDGEFLYGDWTSPVDPTTARSDDGYIAPQEGNPVYDINRDNAAMDIEDANSFCARHKEGVKYYEDLDGITFKTAKYESLGSVKPVRDPLTGALSNADEDNPTSVCKTGNESNHYVGRVDATIWLEGWDYAIIDEEFAHAFDFGLTFEINKVGVGN